MYVYVYIRRNDLIKHKVPGQSTPNFMQILFGKKKQLKYLRKLALVPIYDHVVKNMSLVFSVVVCSGKRRFQKFFSYITTVSGCDSELNAHLCCLTEVSCPRHST